MIFFPNRKKRTVSEERQECKEILASNACGYHPQCELSGETPDTPTSLRTENTTLPANRSRQIGLFLRLNEKENACLVRRAKKAGIDRSSFLRLLILDEPILDSEPYEAIRHLSVEISRVGNTVNQIARRWNESGSDMSDIAFLDEKMGEIMRIMMEVERNSGYSHSRQRQ